MVTSEPDLTRKQRSLLHSRLVGPLTLVAGLYLAPSRRSRAEDVVDFKTLFYQEDNNRIRIFEPSVLWERQLHPKLTLRVDAVYDSISGASPTGAPPVPTRTVQTTRSSTPTRTATPVRSSVVYEDDGHEEDDDHEEEREGQSGLYVPRGRSFALPAPRAAPYAGAVGATPVRAPTPAPAAKPQPVAAAPGSGGGTTTTTITEVPGKEVPKADATDTRVAFNVELIGSLGRHTPALQLTQSTENDYSSTGIAVRDAIDFNQKNTTLQLGLAMNYDLVDGLWVDKEQEKQTYDALVGVTQVLTPNTLLTFNLSGGHSSGYLDDPYKIVEKNGVLVPEKRPDTRDKQVVFLALNHYVDALNGSADLSYRWYNDSFGVQADTLALAWYQKLGSRWIVRPQVRYYRQTEADFYGVRFTGNPQEYSADYRLSELEAIGYGLKLIWKPNDRFSLDVSFDRYDERGTDGETSQDAYPSANFIQAGLRIWL